MEIIIQSIRAQNTTPKPTNKKCPICSKSLRSGGKWSRWQDGHAEHNACMNGERYNIWLQELAAAKSKAPAQ